MSVLEFLAYVMIGMGVFLLGKMFGLGFLPCYAIAAIIVVLVQIRNLYVNKQS